MKEPKLTLALAERGDQPVLLVSRNDNNLLNRIDISLSRLADLGYMGACEQIGNTALRMLHRFHVKVFESYPALTPPRGLVITPYDLILHLHQLSLADRTQRYLGAMEALFERHAEELALTSLPEQWSMLRESVMRFSD